MNYSALPVVGSKSRNIFLESVMGMWNGWITKAVEGKSFIADSVLEKFVGTYENLDAL